MVSATGADESCYMIYALLVVCQFSYVIVLSVVFNLCDFRVASDSTYVFSNSMLTVAAS